MQVCLLHKNTQKTNVTENHLTILKMTTSIQLNVSGENTKSYIIRQLLSLWQTVVCKLLSDR